MRIVIVSREGAADRRYGLGRAVGRVAEGLRQRGHQVWYRTREDWGPREQRRLERLQRLLPASLRGPFAERLVQGWQAAGFALQEKATHVWLQDPWLVPGLRWRLRCRGHLRRPFRWGVSEHGLGSFAWAVRQDGIAITPAWYRRLLRCERRWLQAADWVWTPSQTALQALLRDLSLPGPPPHWSATGYGAPELDREMLKQAASRPVDGRRRVGQVPLLLCVGRLAPVKAYDQVVRALLLLQREHDLPVRLWIAGEGQPGDLPPEADELIHPPRMEPVERIESALGRADLYLSACAAESFGLASREAVAAGLPCVVASGGASDEVLSGGAWSVPAEPAAMAAALRVLLTDETAAAFWRRQSRRAAAGWAGWDTVIDAMEGELQGV
ncbi:MAG: glycosyltransferase family 4 protein [Pseudomonadota bacterium]